MKYTVEIAGRSLDVELVRQGQKIWAVRGEKRVPVELHQHAGSGLHTLIYGHRRLLLWLTGEGTGYAIHWRGRTYLANLEPSSVRRFRHHLRLHPTAKPSEEVVKSYMPGLIVKVEVQEGQRVQQGDGLLVIDAMKMENEIRSPCDGIIRKMAVEAGREVSRDQVLCVITTNHALGGSL